MNSPLFGLWARGFPIFSQKQEFLVSTVAPRLRRWSCWPFRNRKGLRCGHKAVLDHKNYEFWEKTGKPPAQRAKNGWICRCATPSVTHVILTTQPSTSKPPTLNTLSTPTPKTLFVFINKNKKRSKNNRKFATSPYLGQPSEDNLLFAVFIKNEKKNRLNTSQN